MVAVRTELRKEDTFEDIMANNTVTKAKELYDIVNDVNESKMKHMMDSDTIIVIVSMMAMIVLGLVFRSLFMKLTSINQRKNRLRGGLKQIAEHMNYVTRYCKLK